MTMYYYDIVGVLELKRTFVYTSLFEQALRSKSQSSGLQEMIESAILEDPKVGRVIQNTGGLRKFRLEDKTRNKGKRGGLRVIYLDLPHSGLTFLLTLYDKDTLDDLSADAKKTMKAIVEEIKRGLK